MSSESSSESYFKLDPYRNVQIEAIKRPDGEAEIRIVRDGSLLRSFGWPSYKVWNIAAHAADIIDDLLDSESDAGIQEAGSDLLGGNVYVR